MKRRCIDKSCNKKFVISKKGHKAKREQAYYKGDEGLCNECFKDIQQITYDQSYFGSIEEWGV